MNNTEVACQLELIADYLEATKNNYKARAYRKAAIVICNMQEQIEQLVKKKIDLKTMPNNTTVFLS